MARISLSISCSPLNPEEMITASALQYSPTNKRTLAAAPCSVLGGVVPAEIGRKINTPSAKKNWLVCCSADSAVLRHASQKITERLQFPPIREKLAHVQTVGTRLFCPPLQNFRAWGRDYTLLYIRTSVNNACRSHHVVNTPNAILVLIINTQLLVSDLKI